MKRFRISSQNIPLAATCAVCVMLYAVGAFKYPGFLSAGVFSNFFADNAVLGIAAVGMTFVILSGGIDLSVGAVVGLVSIVSAVLLETHHWSPFVVIPVVICVGALLGLVMGLLIRVFELPAFLVTLAGMFFARGMAFTVRLESMPIATPLYTRLADFRLPVGGGLDLPATAITLLVVVVLGMYLAHCTSFGRNVYAIGGNEEAAKLMGLPVGQAKVGVYVLSGTCAALAGVMFTIYSSAGNPTAGTGLELDCIASVVIGGTLLTGGVGTVFGTLVGVLIFGIIQTLIMFQGTLSSWWTSIVIGALLLVFILLQKALAQGARKGQAD